MSCNTIGFRLWERTSSRSRFRWVERRRSRPWLLELEERRLLATFTVSNGNDSGDGSLRAAITQANATRGANTIQISSDLENSTITLISQLVLSNTTGIQTITGPAGVTLTAGGQHRVLDCAAGTTAVISGITTITGGNGDNGNFGAIINQGNLTLANCTVSGSTATAYKSVNGLGGGIGNYGTLTLTNCTISGNAGGSGGGLWNQGMATLTNCTLSGNTASQQTYHGVTGGSGDGGGLENDGTVVLNNCTISGNTASATNGGGVANYGTATLTNCTVSGNKSAEYGGGVYNHGTATLTDCTVTSNAATGVSSHGYGYYGGGLYNGGTATLERCTFSNDTATGYGGGIYNNSNATLTNCTFVANSAGSTYYGGGLYNNDNASISSCTFTSNTAAYGGGLYCSQTLDIWDTIVAGNTGTSGGPDVYGTVHSGGLDNALGGHNLIGKSDGSSGWESSDLIGTVAAPLDPHLAALAFYGGPTQTMALLPGSPAIGKGTNDVNGVSTDQRGFSLDNPPDIGAFQIQSGPSVLQVTTTDEGSSTPFGALDLGGAVNLANVLPGAHTITFDPNGFAIPFANPTITLTSGQLVLSNKTGTETIDGPAAGVTVSGGGLSQVFQVDAGVTASISGLTITGGKATSGGGLANSGTLTLTNCTISGNTAGAGGGLWNDGTATLINCTISSDTASNHGGDAFNEATMSLANCTISGNTAGAGGGLYNETGAATLSSTIVAGNTSTSSPPGASDIAGPVSVSGAHNLIGTGGSGGLANGVNGNIVLASLTGLGLAPLGFYGGPTQTMAILPGSPAVGAGTSAAGVTTDQRGFPLENPPDIGAFQVSNSLAFQVNTTAGGLPAPVGDLSLAGAVHLANLMPGATTITFAPTVFGRRQTILVTSGQLELSNKAGTETINGPAAGLIVSANRLSRVFQIDGGVTASISGLTIAGGNAKYGGGVLNYGTADLTGCTIAANTAAYGGGLRNTSAATLNLTSCSITANNAGDAGGGLETLGLANLTDCTISGNSAASGGGLASFATGRTTLINCTISGNAATGNGGGVYDRTGPVNLTNCTISGNTAGAGGGIANTATATLRDTIVALNTAAKAPDFSGAVVSQGNNLIGKTDGSSGWVAPGAGNSDLTGTSASPLDPKLAPLGNFGGPTQTMALLPGSPAIGNGSSGVVPAILTTDQRGMPRGSLVDIGAFQTSLVVQSTSGSVITTPIDQLTLPGAVSLATSFAGPIAISFSPAVFAPMQTITLANQLELSKTGTIPTWTITGPAAGVTVSGGELSRVFQVDPGVTAFISGLTMTGGNTDEGGGLLNRGTVNLANCNIMGNKATIAGGGLFNEYGTAFLTNCTASGNTAGGPGATLVSSAGTLSVNSSTISGSTTAIQVENGAIATITGGVVSTGSGTGILVGSSAGDACTVAIHNVDLSANKTGVQNNANTRAVDAALNWWGSSSGPGGSGASTAVGLVNFSPWLGDTGSLKLAVPDSLGFASGQGESYAVTPIATGPGSPELSVAPAASSTTQWYVTPTGTIVFVGNGGSVTINGEAENPLSTNAFFITNAAVTYAANDAFKGATIDFSGGISRTVVGRGTANTFGVSGWTSAGTLKAPNGAVNTVVDADNAGYVLSDGSLESTDGLNLSLSGITAASLTVMTTSNVPTVINASAFTGATNVTVGGTGAAIVYGSKGGARVSTTGSGHDVLIGGPGKNRLTDQGTGRNILIGGGGPSRIQGNGNDILIGGKTVYDRDTAADHAALDAILSRWSSSDRYGERWFTIQNGIKVGAHTYGLNEKSVHSSGKSSSLSDGPRQSKNENWFIVGQNDSYTQRDEQVTVIHS